MKVAVVRIIQRFPRIFRKWLILYEKICRHILKRASFCETIQFFLYEPVKLDPRLAVLNIFTMFRVHRS